MEDKMQIAAAILSFFVIITLAVNYILAYRQRHELQAHNDRICPHCAGKPKSCGECRTRDDIDGDFVGHHFFEFYYACMGSRIGPGNHIRTALRSRDRRWYSLGQRNAFLVPIKLLCDFLRYFVSFCVFLLKCSCAM